jgi:hypothetical protein
MCISRTVWALGSCQWYGESCFAGAAVSRDGWIVATNSQAGHSLVIIDITRDLWGFSLILALNRSLWNAE